MLIHSFNHGFNRWNQYAIKEIFYNEDFLFLKSIMKYVSLLIPSGMSFKPFRNMFVIDPNEYEAQEDSVAHILFPRKTKIDNRQYKNGAFKF